MTDKPNTLSLNARQWRVLMADHLDVLKAGVSSSEVLNEDGLKVVMHHIDQVRLMAVAWYQNSPAPVADAAGAVTGEQIAAPANANGAAPKRKGGWPAGRPRKRQIAAAVQ